MSLLIAGAGYLGQHLVSLASANFSPVSALTLSGESNTLACDLGDPDSVKALAEKISAPMAIIHCASSNRGGPEAYRNVFVEGSKNLITAFPSARLLLTSSTSVYHQTDGSEVTETSPTSPDRETSRLLLEAETIVLNSGGIVARLGGLYGPGRSIHFRKVQEDTAVLEGDGSRWLNQIHVEDAARACLHLLEISASGCFNVTDNQPLTQKEVYQALTTHFNKPMPPSGPKATNRKRAWTDKKVLNTKLQASGWQPNYPSFTEAIPYL